MKMSSVVGTLARCRAIAGAAIGLLPAIVMLAGCGPRRAEWQIPPKLDPRAVTQAVMQAADANGDAALDEQELAAVPALRDSRAALDTDGDGRLAASEIEAWLNLVKQEAAGAREAPLLVKYRGQPVANARVRVVPEACMGGTIEPGEGVTDPTGLVLLNIPARRWPGIRCGLYRVEVTGTVAGGASIPAKYNTATTLGLALGGGLPQERTPVMNVD